MCSLAVVLSVALGSGILPAAEEAVIDGTVVKVEFPMMTIETAKKERWEFSMEGGIKPKVGQKVTVHYTATGRGKHIAYRLEKAP